MTASPESQLGEKWTGPWNVLLTTPTMVKLAGIKPWTHHTGIKKALEEKWTTEPQADLKVIFKNNDLYDFSLFFLFHYFSIVKSHEVMTFHHFFFV